MLLSDHSSGEGGPLSPASPVGLGPPVNHDPSQAPPGFPSLGCLSAPRSLPGPAPAAYHGHPCSYPHSRRQGWETGEILPVPSSRPIPMSPAETLLVGGLATDPPSSCRGKPVHGPARHMARPAGQTTACYRRPGLFGLSSLRIEKGGLFGFGGDKKKNMRFWCDTRFWW